MQPNPARKLYTPIAAAICRFLKAERIDWKKHELARIRREIETLEIVIANPKATEKQKRIARIELAGKTYKPNRDEK